MRNSLGEVICANGSLSGNVDNQSQYKNYSLLCLIFTCENNKPRFTGIKNSNDNPENLIKTKDI